MKKNLYLLVLFAVLLIAGLYFGTTGSSKYNWNRTYRTDATDPYDLSLFYNTVKENWGIKFNEIPLKSGLEEEKNLLQPAFGDIYMFVGNRFNLSNRESRLLYNHIADGGTAFISATAFPTSFLTRFKSLENLMIGSVYEEAYTTTFAKKLIKPDAYSFTHYYKNEPQQNDWYYFSKGMVEWVDTGTWEESGEYVHPREESPEVMEIISSSGEDKPDFLVLRVGSGRLFLHSNPVVFSNYYLKQKKGRDYTENILKFLPDKRIIWDLSAVLYREDANIRQSDRNMLSFVRSQPGLWIAWILLLVSVALFLIFAGRRLQRSIPVIKPPVNHTMAFVQAVGRFYYGEKQNVVVFKREWNQFLIFIRQHFRVAAINSDSELSALSERSGVNESIIREIVMKHEKYSIFTELKSSELLDMNKSISQFYTEYKKYGRK